LDAGEPELVRRAAAAYREAANPLGLTSS
jgi:hypothetical protein